jgi:hypothetical protein
LDLGVLRNPGFRIDDFAPPEMIESKAADAQFVLASDPNKLLEKRRSQRVPLKLTQTTPCFYFSTA